MPYDPARHHRRSIRLSHYDYALPGWYFVTVCVRRRLRLLGDVEGDAVRLTPAGRMVESWWHRLPHKFPHLRLDALIVMPDHVHGLLGLVDDPAAAHQTGTVPQP